MPYIYCYFRWLKQEYEIPFLLNKQPPVHMPIAYGLVNVLKGGTPSEKARPHSQALSLSQDSFGGRDMGIQGTCKPGKTIEVEHCSLCSAGNEVCWICSITWKFVGCSITA